MIESAGNEHRKGNADFYWRFTRGRGRFKHGGLLASLSDPCLSSIMVWIWYLNHWSYSITMPFSHMHMFLETLWNYRFFGLFWSKRDEAHDEDQKPISQKPVHTHKEAQGTAQGGFASDSRRNYGEILLSILIPKKTRRKRCQKHIVEEGHGLQKTRGSTRRKESLSWARNRPGRPAQRPLSQLA